MRERTLLVLDFDGFLVNSYELIRSTFATLGLDIGDEGRFQNRRKFLKYLGGGKELLRNLVSYSLPKKRRFRTVLTEEYLSAGRIYPSFTPFLNQIVAEPDLHVGIVSRNFTLQPGTTIRAVLRNSGIDEDALDFVIPLPIGATKNDVLQAMRSTRHRRCVLGADEICDFKAASAAGYEPVIASYGFDRLERLTEKGGVPRDRIAATPEAAVELLTLGAYDLMPA